MLKINAVILLKIINLYSFAYTTINYPAAKETVKKVITGRIADRCRSRVSRISWIRLGKSSLC